MTTKVKNPELVKIAEELNSKVGELLYFKNSRTEYAEVLIEKWARQMAYIIYFQGAGSMRHRMQRAEQLSDNIANVISGVMRIPDVEDVRLEAYFKYKSYMLDVAQRIYNRYKSENTNPL